MTEDNKTTAAPAASQPQTPAKPAKPAVTFDRISDDVARAYVQHNDKVTTHLGTITWQKDIPTTFYPTVHTFMTQQELEEVLAKMKAGNKA